MPFQPGSTVALITPMDATTGAVNYEELRALLDWHMAAGTNNLCILGTTGEASVLDREERKRVWQTAVEQCKGRLPILAGTGGIHPGDVQATTQMAADVGCDAALVVTPYYVKPPQRGLIKYFTTLADMPNGLPVILYNVPGRTAVDMSDESIAICAQHEKIIGLKDATGNLNRLTQLQQLLQDQSTVSSSDFLCLSGDDATLLDFCLLGGQGGISVTANVAPHLVRQMLDQAALTHTATSDSEAAKAAATNLNDRLAGLHRDLFCESNPIPTKWALTQPIVRTANDDDTTTTPILSSEYCRPPLDRLDPSCYSVVEQALRQANLLLS